MHDPTQPDGITDHELLESVFDVVDDLRDSVVEKHGRARNSLMHLRDRSEASEQPGIDVGPEGLDYVCPGCDSGTRNVTVAVQRGEACPICGVSRDVAAIVSEARSRTIGPSGRVSLARRYPLVAFLVARGAEAGTRDDPSGQALAQLVDRVTGWPRRGDGRMSQRDEDLLRIAAAAYDTHPDYDPRWAVR